MAPGYRVGIDGYNLAIPRGTGVATYARSLAACVHGLGHPVDLLYGMDIATRAAPLARQAAFIEQLQAERAYRRPRYPSVGWGTAMLAAWRGQAACPVPLDDRRDEPAVAARLPVHDRVLNVGGLFGRAAHYFKTFDRFMTVRMPNPPVIMHWTYPVPVRLAGARNIYTVHDLVPLRLPEATLDHKPTHVRLLAGCMKWGEHIVTVSERSREDLFAFFPQADPARVTNTYQAVPDGPVPEDADAVVRDGFGLVPGGYFLFFGSIEPKKNVARLLEAFLGAAIDIPLVVVTARGWQAGAEAALLAGADPRRVRQIEYMPQATLLSLIAGARAVTFPSIYEGFGLPVLEAMRLGTPVLTSREGSLPEVAGDAAEYVDAFDVTSIRAGLERLAGDDALCAGLSARGLVQAELFSMARYRQRVAALYKAVLA